MNVRDKKGSITVFVLIGLLFMTGFLIISFGNNLNKSKSAKEQFNIMSGIYSRNDGDASAYERAYTDIRRRNAQILTYDSSEEGLTSVSTVELTKTFDDNLIDYKIYGNSIQDTEKYGTPSPDNPVEIQSVGDRTVNLFDVNSAMIVYRNGSVKETKTETGYILTNSNTTANFIVAKIGDTEDWIGKTLTMNYNANNGGSIYWVYFDEAGNNRSAKYENTITIDSTNVCFGLRINASLADPNFQFEYTDIQIVEGKTQKEYEPYGKYKIPVKVTGTAKNLLDLTKLQGITSSGGNASNTKMITSTTNKGIVIKCEPNTKYVLQLSNSISKFRFFYYETEPILGETISIGGSYMDSGNLTGSTIAKFTTPSNANWIGISLGKNAEMENTKVWLTKGTNEVEYEPYVEPQTFNIYLDEPLRKVGEYADYINFSNGEVVRNVEVIDNTGTLIIEDSMNSIATQKEENIELQELRTYEDYTKIEILTEIAPSKIEATYYGYTME